MILMIPISYYLYAGIFLFSILMLTLISFMLVYISIKKQLVKKANRRRNIAEILIHKAVFFEDDVSGIGFYRGIKLVKNLHFRNILTEEILSAKRNISGESALRLQAMYLQLKLDHYALKKLEDRRWYIKAQGIQEIAQMDLNSHMMQIMPFADSPNELVRMEAQTAVVKMAGYQGLNFLDTAVYPVTDWQQIKLLKELPHLPSDDNLNNIAGWLTTSNDSVAIFAMKIARTYHLFQLHDAIIGCLSNQSERVRLEAIRTLRDIYLEETSSYLKGIFPTETLKNRVAIIKALQVIGSEDDIQFLLSHLAQSDNDLKLHLLRAVSFLGNQSLAELIDLPGRDEYPLRDMIKQINMEGAG